MYWCFKDACFFWHTNMQQKQNQTYTHILRLMKCGLDSILLQSSSVDTDCKPLPLANACRWQSLIAICIPDCSLLLVTSKILDVWRKWPFTYCDVCFQRKCSLICTVYHRYFSFNMYVCKSLHVLLKHFFGKKVPRYFEIFVQLNVLLYCGLLACTLARILIHKV